MIRAATTVLVSRIWESIGKLGAGLLLTVIISMALTKMDMTSWASTQMGIIGVDMIDLVITARALISWDLIVMVMTGMDMIKTVMVQMDIIVLVMTVRGSINLAGIKAGMIVPALMNLGFIERQALHSTKMAIISRVTIRMADVYKRQV